MCNEADHPKDFSTAGAVLSISHIAIAALDMPVYTDLFALYGGGGRRVGDL